MEDKNLKIFPLLFINVFQGLKWHKSSLPMKQAVSVGTILIHFNCPYQNTN